MNRTGRGFGEWFTKWIENPRIPGVRKTVTSSADTVDTAHVGLVLDRPARRRVIQCSRRTPGQLAGTR